MSQPLFIASTAVTYLPSLSTSSTSAGVNGQCILTTSSYHTAHPLPITLRSTGPPSRCRSCILSHRDAARATSTHTRYNGMRPRPARRLRQQQQVDVVGQLRFRRKCHNLYQQPASGDNYRRVSPHAEIPLPTPQGDDLHWKDRVALYAQFSADETLHALLHALQLNARSGPHKDDGIDALYAFANVDIWAISHRFFGKKQDLGQFERFKRVVVAYPYNILLRQDYTSKTLSALHVTQDVYVSRKMFQHPDNHPSMHHQPAVFTFTMRRLQFGGGTGRAWMVDSIIHDESAQEKNISIGSDNNKDDGKQSS